jgi:diphosphomevalonate decarboxylase
LRKVSTFTATAVAHPNIAFIKYWGNRDHALRLPVNGSISMNLQGLYTQTNVTFDPALKDDELILNEKPSEASAQKRVSLFLDHVRDLAKLQIRAKVISQNNFPTGAGIASSAAAFAALSLAASRAAGLDLDESALSRLARLGSGSACRSVPGGFVEWQPGTGHEDSFAYSIAGPDHWNLVDCIAVVQESHKPVGSTAGHQLAETSPFQPARIAGAAERLDSCRASILQRDIQGLAAVTELDSNLMHAVMMTSTPPLFYWASTSIEIMKQVRTWREKKDIPVFYTLDAGPNVHVITIEDFAIRVKNLLAQIPGVRNVLSAAAGGPAHWDESI